MNAPIHARNYNTSGFASLAWLALSLRSQLKSWRNRDKSKASYTLCRRGHTFSKNHLYYIPLEYQQTQWSSNSSVSEQILNISQAQWFATRKWLAISCPNHLAPVSRVIAKAIDGRWIEILSSSNKLTLISLNRL